MKFGMSHYGNKSIPNAKFESDSFSSFGDMTSQNSLRRREQVMKFGYLTPENEFNFKKMSFYVQNRSSGSKIYPSCQFQQIFKHRKKFSFSKFLGRLDEKRAAATPLIDQFF